MTSRSPAAMSVFAWVLIALTAAGCSSWQAMPFPPSAAPAPAVQPDPVRLRMADGKKLTLYDWKLEGDTLRGSREAWEEGARVLRPETIALGEVAGREETAGDEDLRASLESEQAAVAAAEKRTSAAPRDMKFPGVVRFRLVDGTSIEIEDAAVDGDSLRGRIPVSNSDPSRRLVIYALEDISHIETRRHDGGKTAGLFLVVGLVILGALAAMASSLDESF